MKRKMLIFAAVLLCCAALTACHTEPVAETTELTTVPVHTGWQEENGVLRYYLEDGTLASGWLILDDELRYLKEDGTLASGWVDFPGYRCYFQADGIPATGWVDTEDGRFFLNANGVPVTGWQELDGKRYYFYESGILCTGWLYSGNNTYYFHEDGTMAMGQTEIGGTPRFFTDDGVYVPLVNPWLSVPDDYAADLLPIEHEQFVEASCYSSLLAMLADCAAAGHKPYVCSGYRTQSAQEYLFERKVSYYLDEGYEEEEARKLAATVVAVPGTSEHQLGLAVDIIDEDYPYLEDEQADTATQQWLMEHCWEYGFILRYPKDKTDITGIIWEPWHYRYVGREIAMEIRDSGLTLEEYLGFTHE